MQTYALCIYSRVYSICLYVWGQVCLENIVLSSVPIQNLKCVHPNNSCIWLRFACADKVCGHKRLIRTAFFFFFLIYQYKKVLFICPRLYLGTMSMCAIALKSPKTWCPIRRNSNKCHNAIKRSGEEGRTRRWSGLVLILCSYLTATYFDCAHWESIERKQA